MLMEEKHGTAESLVGAGVSGGRPADGAFIRTRDESVGAQQKVPSHLKLTPLVRVLLCCSFTEFLEPFERVIQPEELWLYKNPLVESDHIPKRVMFVSTRLPFCAAVH